MCEKKPYDTKDEARAAASGIGKKVKNGFKVYRCRDPECMKKFHLQSMRTKRLTTPRKAGKYPLRIQDYLIKAI